MFYLPCCPSRILADSRLQRAMRQAQSAQIFSPAASLQPSEQPSAEAVNKSVGSILNPFQGSIGRRGPAGKNSGFRDGYVVCSRCHVRRVYRQPISKPKSWT